MKIFEILAVTSSSSMNGGPFVPSGGISYLLHDDAHDLLEPILAPYDQGPEWYFDKVNFGRPPAPWAFVCLDREYRIAGHVATSRPDKKGIAFTTYQAYPGGVPKDFIPEVGMLCIMSKKALEQAAESSPLFKKAWQGLHGCSADRRWLVILDPLPAKWVSKEEPRDEELWKQATQV